MSNKYIHLLDQWPHFKWDLNLLAKPLSETRHKQGRLLGYIEGLGFPLLDEANLATLTTEIVKSSAIEGKIFNIAQVRSSLALRLGLDIGGVAPTSRSIDGFVEMMLDAVLHYDAPLTSKRLFGWHAALFPTGYSGLRKIIVGSWRTADSGPMQVVSGNLYRQKVHFEAPRAKLIPQEMDIFLNWFNSTPTICPVIKAAIGHLWFITIHPFEDGNGRIARTIAEVLLARADGIQQRFYSMSAQIESERAAYYEILEKTQKGSLDITSWLSWFIGCLDRSMDRAQDTLDSVLFKAAIWKAIGNTRINDRQRKVLNRLLDGFEGFLTSSKYAKIAKCSHDTALRDIKELLTCGIVLKNDGKGRSVSYRLGSPVTIMRY